MSPSIAMPPAWLSRLAKRATDENIGSAQMEDSSASAVVSTLAPVAVVAVVYFVAFILLRKHFPAYYSPRSFHGRTLGAPRRELGGGYLTWVRNLFAIPDSDVIRDNSLDAFLLLRLLKMGSLVCLVGAVITWPVLLPINITGGNGNTQFNILNFGNVKNPWKYFAHAGCAWIFFLFVIYFISRETIYLINLRHAYILSPKLRERISTRTVLFTSVPEDYLNQEKLYSIFGAENVEKIWFPTDTAELTKLWEERNELVARLEGAEVSVIRLAVQRKLKGEGADVESSPAVSTGLVGRWVSEKDRPTHRLKPLVGEKVDTINYCRAEIANLTGQIDPIRAKHHRGDADLYRSVFVLFRSIPAAYDAYQSVTHHTVAMTPRYIGITPGQVLWENLNIRSWERVIRRTVSIAFACALTIFWAIPVAFVASIANVDKLVELLPWLGFLNKLPSVIMGVVTGLLPVIAVSILVSLVPVFFRLAAKLGGAASTPQVEVTTNNMFFGFQLVQVFLVATLGSAAPAVVQSVIDDPSSVTSLLAESIPKSSTFYLCWFILQGLGSVGGQLVSVVGLILMQLFSKSLWNTPRKLFMGGMPRTLQLGSVYAPYTLLIIIALGYACIAPIALGFAAIALFLFWFVWRYNLLFTTGDSIDTRGQLYADTLQHLFVGLYISQLCLIGLFAIGIGTSRASLGPFILMIILLVVTALYQINFNKAVRPLLYAVPRNLTSRLRHDQSGYESAAPGTGKTFEDGVLDEQQQRQQQYGDDMAVQEAEPKANPIVRFFKPHVHATYEKWAPFMPPAVPVSDAEELEHAYVPPARWEPVGSIWLPDDRAVLAGSGGPVSEKGRVSDSPVVSEKPAEHVPAGPVTSDTPSFAMDERRQLIEAGIPAQVNPVVVVEADGKLALRTTEAGAMTEAYYEVNPQDKLW